MSQSLYQATAPVMVRALNKLSALLDKAVDHGVTDAEMAEMRLAPDMLAFPKQIQVCSNTCKFAMARLTATEGPAMPDTETTFAELKARLARTVAFVEGIDPALFEGAGDRPVVIKFPGAEMRFNGQDYVNQFVLPNLYFHITVAYALLRARGVKIGKSDYLPMDPAAMVITG